MSDVNGRSLLYRRASPLTRTADWLSRSVGGLVALALVVGVGAGLGAVFFRYLIWFFTWLFTGTRDYSAAGHVGYGPFGPWFVLFTPIVGGLLYGPMIYRWAREARGHGVPEVMLAVSEKGGRIRPQVAVVKSVASALTIGSGGSVGREGPIVQIGSALGSTLGQVVRANESRLRILVACGAAGGISATFNAPIAGTFFALELILRDFEAESFGVVVLSSFVADVIGRAFFGSSYFLHLPDFAIRSAWEYPLYALLGLLAALVGVAFIRILYGTEDLADRIWHGPEWLRPAAGGILLGLLLFALPELYGVGYPPLANAITGRYAVWFLLLLLAGKLAATSTTIAIGGSGGVFAPSLFMGAMLGSAFGTIAGHVAPFPTAPAGAYGIVAMGAVFGAAARAPITAVIIIFELTGDYTIILPLLLAVAVAVGGSSLLSRDTIYTLKLRRRGIELLGGRRSNLMKLLRVSDAMQPLPPGLDSALPILDVASRLEAARVEGLPVMDAEGVYRGIVDAAQVDEAIRDNVLDATAGDLARDLSPLHAGESLEHALSALLRARSGLPVLDGKEERVVGWLTQGDLLRAYRNRLEGPQQEVAAAPAKTVARRGPAVTRGVRLVDIRLADAAELVGRRVSEIPWPRSAVLIALVRAGDAVELESDPVLEAGDRITLLIAVDDAEGLLERLAPASVS